MATTEAGRRVPDTADNTRNVNAQLGAASTVAFVLVVGAFITGWNLSRRWRRFIGW